jgi:hypothetical protein
VRVATLPPAAADGSCGEVVHLVIAADGAIDTGTVALVEGDVSDVALRGFRDHAPPASTVERVVPVRVVATASGLLLAPARPLDEGRHTLVVGSAMSRTPLEVRARSVPRLSRFFPAKTSTAEALVSVYCGAAALPADAHGLDSPGTQSSAVFGVLGDAAFDGCVTVATPAGAPPPPALYSGTGLVAELEPPPLATAHAPSSATSTCATEQLAFGPACLDVDDDRITVTSPTGPFAAVHAGPALAMGVLGDPLRLRGLAPSSSLVVTGRFLDAAGTITTAEIEVTLRDAHAHVVVNEVMARPFSSDNHAQWLELANDGTIDVDLGGWGLETSHASYVLPGVIAWPGTFPLLVDPAFATSVSDVPLPGDATLVPLDHLGTKGLLRTSEIITLIAPDGTTSRAPSKRSSPGKSLSRASPDALDVETSWSLAAPTPGRPNGP